MSTTQPTARPLVPRGERLPHLHALTSLRYFAALHVLLLHTGIVLELSMKDVPAWVANLIGNGYLGVPLFFLLSGFVMSYTYLSEQGVAKVRLDAKRYWVARVARIYPVYLLSLAIAAPFFIQYKLQWLTGLMGFAKGTIKVVLHLTLLQSWYPKIINDWVGPAWSLSVEAFFYAVFPLMVACIDFSKLDQRRLYQAIIGLFTISLTLSLAAMFAYQFNPGLDKSAIVGQRCVIPLLRLPDFLVGMALGRLFLLRQWQSGSQAKKPPLPISMGLAIALLGAMSLITEAADHNVVSSLMMPGFALLIYRLSCEAGLMNKALALPVLILLGEASYSLYILHMPLLGWLHLLAGETFKTPWLSLGASALSMSLLSVAVFRYFEAPLRTIIKQRFTTGPQLS